MAVEASDEERVLEVAAEHRNAVRSADVNFRACGGEETPAIADRLVPLTRLGNGPRCNRRWNPIKIPALQAWGMSAHRVGGAAGELSTVC